MRSEVVGTISIQHPCSLARSCPQPTATRMLCGCWRTSFSWDCAPLFPCLGSLPSTSFWISFPRHSSWTESPGSWPQLPDVTAIPEEVQGPPTAALPLSALPCLGHCHHLHIPQMDVRCPYSLHLLDSRRSS